MTPANIPTKLRSSGIVSVGDVPWGTHFCHFYETPQDLLDILIPYFKAGLENNELCMWIVCDPIAEADGHRALRNAVPEFDRRLAAGDIEIVPHSQWCFREGIFDGQRVIAGWKEKLGRAQARRLDLVLFLPIDPRFDDILGEDVALEQEGVILLERFNGLIE